MLQLRKATQEDIDAILRTARQENVDELEVLGIGLQDALLWSLDHSSEACVALLDGEPVCAFGVVATDQQGVGRPWMVGTSAIDRHSFAFLRSSKIVIADLLTRWDLLVNYADTRNSRGLRWLRFMGFTIHPAELIGEKPMPFHRFEKGAIVCAPV